MKKVRQSITCRKLDGKEIKISVSDKEEIDLAMGWQAGLCTTVLSEVQLMHGFCLLFLKGIMEKMEIGPLTGSYARDIRVYVYDGKMHPVDSNEISFRLAGSNAFSQAFKNASPKIHGACL
ncbi:MAG: hypothetical protein MZV63_39515 [Marinilabiliales bacterium]|nr:hypothetical protein [Marinilabiliales bacterium]